LLVDEAAAPGGQIYRAITETPLAANRAVLGASYWQGEKLAQAFFQCTASYLPGTSVWYLDRELKIGLSRQGKAQAIAARRVVLATGAMERPFPIPGWTLPGVMGAGAAQTLLKSAGMVPEGRVVLAGTGPLLWLLAAQYAAAGAPPAAILDTTPAENRRSALPHLPAFLASPYPWKGLALLARTWRATRVISGVTEVSIEGTPARAERIRFRRGSGPAEEMEADYFLLHQGVVPNLNLAVAAGCRLAWDEARACFEPEVDIWGNSSTPGVAIAGDGAGIAGAEAAAFTGAIAALEAAHVLGRLAEHARDSRAAPLRASLGPYLRGRPFLDLLYRPAQSFRTAADDAIACRCEEVTGRQIREATALGAQGPNQLKAFLRCGMGPCQGRMCGLTVTETMAAARGVSPAGIGHLRTRAPVKPITVAELASMPRSPEEVRAVVRV
jgi:NADPH-dependent 2,4-dienoyl-CoA reductase/sulfur reductase-like enzyme